MENSVTLVSFADKSSKNREKSRTIIEDGSTNRTKIIVRYISLMIPVHRKPRWPHSPLSPLSLSFSLVSLIPTHLQFGGLWPRMDAEWTRCRVARSPIAWPRFHFGRTHLNTDGGGLFSCHNRGHSRPHFPRTTHIPLSVFDLLSRRFSPLRNTAQPMLFCVRDGQ